MCQQHSTISLHFKCVTVRKQGNGFAKGEDWVTESIRWEWGRLQWCDEEIQSGGTTGYTGPKHDFPAVSADRGTLNWQGPTQTGGMVDPTQTADWA